MVDDEFDGHERVDPVGVTSQGDDGVAHGGEVDDSRHAGQVLHEDAFGREGNLLGGLTRGLAVMCRVLSPTSEGLDVRGVYFHAVFVSKEILQEDLDRVRQSVDAQRRERVGAK